MSMLDLSPLFFSLSVIKSDYALILRVARAKFRAVRDRCAPPLHPPPLSH
ncbi:hypothetical protein [Azospirillum sp. TSO35-2]|nr:hypothetical protein [Azospirillum sp. TSO35-2]